MKTETTTVWCLYSYEPVGKCGGHQTDMFIKHHEAQSQLGLGDEPQGNGALVVVWFGDYRYQEVWVRSGAMIGNWYCLGNEFRRPKVWIDTRSPMEKMMTTGREPEPRPGPGEIPQHPTWDDVVRRGPVTLLTSAPTELYRQGWAAGRKALADEIAELAEDDRGADR